MSDSARLMLARGLGLLTLVIPIASAIVVLVQNVVPSDVLTYLGAGERLNAGHQLYALTAGDRAIELKPLYGNSPLLSPPLIAIVFRPIALLGEFGAGLWWLATALVVIGFLGWLIWRSPIRAGLVIGILTVPILWQVAFGNLNAAIVALLALGWHWRGTPRSGIVVSIAAALKIVPLAFLLWSRQWRAAALTGVVLGALCLLGAGPANTLAYVGSASGAQATDLSVSGFLTTLGVPPIVAIAAAYAILLAGTIAAYVLPERPGYVVAVVAMVIGSPAVNIHSFALLTLALLPFVDAKPSEPRSRLGLIESSP